MGDDADDADSVTASAADHSFVRLSTFSFFSDRYPESRRLSSLSLPPRLCENALSLPYKHSLQ